MIYDHFKAPKAESSQEEQPSEEAKAKSSLLQANLKCIAFNNEGTDLAVGDR